MTWPDGVPIDPEDGRYAYGSRGPIPCEREGCGHDVTRHLSALERGRCVRCDCPTFQGHA